MNEIFNDLLLNIKINQIKKSNKVDIKQFNKSLKKELTYITPDIENFGHELVNIYNSNYKIELNCKDLKINKLIEVSFVI